MLHSAYCCLFRLHVQRTTKQFSHYTKKKIEELKLPKKPT